MEFIESKTSDNRLYELLKRNAPKDICNEGANVISDGLTVTELLSLYKKHVDFCFDSGYPNKSMLKEFGAEHLLPNGFYIDVAADLHNPKKLICLGASKLNIDVTGFSVSEIYAKDDVNLTINAYDDSFLMMDIFDSTKLNVTTANNAKVIVNVYGDALVESEGNVKVILKHKNKY